MSISAEVARLAAIEALAPTDALLAETNFPTLAGRLVFDSRSPNVDEVGGKQVPTLALFTRSAASPRRGDGAGSVSRFGRTIIEIVAEISVVDHDEHGDFVDALTSGPDPQARIKLAALCAQVRYTLLQGPTGHVFRKAVMAVDGIDMEAFAIPELGLRYHRNTLRYDCQIPDDQWGEAGGLPEPAASIMAMFHDQSPARRTLQELAASFRGEPCLLVIETIAFETKLRGVSGQAGEDCAVNPPFADIPE